MLIVDWPSTLPEIVHSQGYGEESPDVLLESDTGNGTPKRRRQASNAEEPVTATQMLNASQRADLKSFFKNDLRSGVHVARWNFRGDGDELVVITGLSWAHLGGDLWRVTYEMQVQP